MWLNLGERLFWVQEVAGSNPAVPTMESLCYSCKFCRVVRGARSEFLLCGRHKTDADFPRYPRLPVLQCAGHIDIEEDNDDTCNDDGLGDR